MSWLLGYYALCGALLLIGMLLGALVAHVLLSGVRALWTGFTDRPVRDSAWTEFRAGLARTAQTFWSELRGGGH